MDDQAPLDADAVAQLLGLAPHPEGGQYVETWRAPSADGERPVGTAIYFLLAAGERSHWHRVDATEIWHHYAGAPLELRTARENAPATSDTLGPDLRSGQRPQLRVEPGEWQSAMSLGDWTLVGCTVSPGFEFANFELAPADWEPPDTVVSAGR